MEEENKPVEGAEAPASETPAEAAPEAEAPVEVAPEEAPETPAE